MPLREKLRNWLHQWADGNWDGGHADGNWDGTEWKAGSEVDPNAVMGTREAMLAEMGDDAVRESDRPSDS